MAEDDDFRPDRDVTDCPGDDTRSDCEIANSLAGHFLGASVGRCGLPSRRSARQALLRIIAFHDKPHKPRPDDGMQMTALIMTSFRPDWVRCLDAGLEHYARNPDAWENEILTPLRSWIDDTDE